MSDEDAECKSYVCGNVDKNDKKSCLREYICLEYLVLCKRESSSRMRLLMAAVLVIWAEMAGENGKGCFVSKGCKCLTNHYITTKTATNNYKCGKNKSYLLPNGRKHHKSTN